MEPTQLLPLPLAISSNSKVCATHFAFAFHVAERSADQFLEKPMPRSLARPPAEVIRASTDRTLYTRLVGRYVGL